MGSTLRNSNLTNTTDPRLLDVHRAAAYLSLSPWTVRDYVARGILRTVQLPASAVREGDAPRNGHLRRVLIDKTDLERLVDSGKGV